MTANYNTSKVLCPYNLKIYQHKQNQRAQTVCSKEHTPNHLKNSLYDEDRRNSYSVNQILKLKKYEQSNKENVNISLIEMSGLSQKFDSNQFKNYCRKKGYHMVYCTNEVNPITQQNTGKGKFMLRSSLGNGRFENPLKDIKNHLNSYGIYIKNSKPKNGLKDIVPNEYIKRLQDEDYRLKIETDNSFNNY